MSIYGTVERSLWRIFYFVYRQALVCVLMTPELCVVEMRKAMLRNHLKLG